MALTTEQQHLILGLLRQADDADLALVAEHTRDLRRSIRRAAAAVETAGLRAEMEAVFNDRAKPRYLAGERVRVVQVNKTTITCRFLDAESRAAQRWPGRVRVPKTMLSPVPVEVTE